MVEPSDDEILAQERERDRALTRTKLWSVLFWMAFALLLVVAFNYGIPQRVSRWAGLPEAAVVWLPIIVLALLWVLALIYRLRMNRARAPLRPSVQRKLVDIYTQRQRRILIAFIPLAAFLAFNQFNISRERAAGDLAAVFAQGAFVFFMLMMALMLVLGPGFLNSRFRSASADELNRALRGRAGALGYVCAMIALGAVYLVYSFAPPDLGRTIPFCMVLAFLVPAIYYVWCDWRAGRDA